jgi:hypothetical protein
LQGLKSLLSLNLNDMQNFTGVGKALIYPVDPVDLAAVADDFETVTLTWDETDMDADAMRLDYSAGTSANGTVATSGTRIVTGTGTEFEEYRIGDLVFIEDETITHKISHIWDDTRMELDSPTQNTDTGLILTVSDNNYTDLAVPALGTETLVVEDLTEVTCYFFRMSTHKRLQWSPYKLHCMALTPAEP